MTQSQLTYVSRGPDKLVMLKRKKVERIFHRCPMSSLKATENDMKH